MRSWCGSVLWRGRVRVHKVLAGCILTVVNGGGSGEWWVRIVETEMTRSRPYVTGQLTNFRSLFWTL